MIVCRPRTVAWIETNKQQSARGKEQRRMRPQGYLCGPRTYSYKGWEFENNASSGVWPLRKDGELRARAGRVFWEVFDAWNKLTPSEKKRTRTGGGCRQI